MKLQVSFFRLRKSLNNKQKGFAPAFPLTYSTVCVQSTLRLALYVPPHLQQTKPSQLAWLRLV